MARDDPLDDGLARSLFSGISRPRPGCPKPEDEIQTSSSEVQSTSDEIKTTDFDALDQALKEAEKYPKVTANSPELAAVMRYNEITLRRYRISTEICY